MPGNYHIGGHQCTKEVESRVRLTPPARFGGRRTHAPQRCDRAYPTERRLDVKMDTTLKGRRQLLTLYREQDGICPICRQEITEITEWHRHHIIRRSNGGKNTAENLVLLHPECHRQAHSLKLEVVKPRPWRDKESLLVLVQNPAAVSQSATNLTQPCGKVSQVLPGREGQIGFRIEF
jgi:5-methylcytosine-specific restriction endonuclease McrA